MLRNLLTDKLLLKRIQRQRWAAALRDHLLFGQSTWSRRRRGSSPRRRGRSPRNRNERVVAALESVICVCYHTCLLLSQLISLLLYCDLQFISILCAPKIIPCLSKDRPRRPARVPSAQGTRPWCAVTPDRVRRSSGCCRTESCGRASLQRRAHRD